MKLKLAFSVDSMFTKSLITFPIFIWTYQVLTKDKWSFSSLLTPGSEEEGNFTSGFMLASWWKWPIEVKWTYFESQNWEWNLYHDLYDFHVFQVAGHECDIYVWNNIKYKSKYSNLTSKNDFQLVFKGHFTSFRT